MSVLLRPAAALLAVLVLAGSATAQSLNLRDLLPDLLRVGVTLAPPTGGVDHSAHFTTGLDDPSGQFAAVNRLNGEIARQLSSYPLSSSAGSFSYEFDSSLGVLTRPTQSFGSIYTERPFTVGRGKYNLGVSFSQFSYDEIDGLGLRDGDLELVFLHEDAAGDGRTTPYFEGDFVAAKLFVDLDVNVTTLSRDLRRRGSPGRRPRGAGRRRGPRRDVGGRGAADRDRRRHAHLLQRHDGADVAARRIG